jgi:hypothetical protein
MAIEPSFSRVSIKQLIEHVPALHDRLVVTTSGDTPLRDTLALLASKGYLSCPVRATDTGEWLGGIFFHLLRHMWCVRIGWLKLWLLVVGLERTMRKSIP